MYQREALYLRFDESYWPPNAVKIGVGKINAVSGAAWDDELHADPQDYIVCPDQLWLDGINAGEGFIRQFVAMPLGQGYTVESQLTGVEEFGGIQIVAYEPLPGKLPDRPPPKPTSGPAIMRSLTMTTRAGEMGLGAGGKMKQKIYPDPYGIDTWDLANRGCVFVHIVNSEQYKLLTGLEPPPTPISAQTYNERGYPWFDLYDESLSDLAAPRRLTTVKSIKQIDAERGDVDPEDEEGTEIAESQVKKIRHPKSSKKI